MLETDEKGRIKLSRKALLERPDNGDRAPRGDRRPQRQAEVAEQAEGGYVTDNQPGESEAAVEPQPQSGQ